MPPDASAKLIALSRDLAVRADALAVGPPAAITLNPLVYARPLHEAYLRRFGGARGRVLFLGMNPGPWGMGQTGVPFGDPEAVRTWMGLEGKVAQPAAGHPRVPILGLASTRREGSGKRLWGWAADRAGTADTFFGAAFVWNYCPLAFLDAKGANVTPDKLSAAARARVTALCDDALAGLIDVLAPRALVGIGLYAEARLTEVSGDRLPIHRLLHPSPANPRAHREFGGQAEALADTLGLPRLSPRE